MRRAMIRCAAAKRGASRCERLSRHRRAASSAVVFDVDGVLIRGAETVSSAPTVLQGLIDRDVPFLVMTNGGGVHESVRAEKLSERFGVPIEEEQIIQSHTPMKGLVDLYHDKPVLIVGKNYDAHLDFARRYGFRFPISVEQYHRAMPLLYPDMKPVEKNVPELPVDILSTPIAAVFAVSDPLYWGRELQICCDVLRSTGLPGEVTDRQTLPLYSSCADFLYAAEYSASPRFGSGSFMTALEALHNGITDDPTDALSYVSYGKPHRVSFQYARDLLEARVDGRDSLQRIYMVGDNGGTDIKGANDAGDPWFSVLTRSGLFKGEGNHPDHPGHAVIDDVGGLLELVDQFESEQE